MEIKIVKLTNLRNEEHFNFHTEINDLITLYVAATLGIEAKYIPYLTAYNYEAEALDVIRKSDKTSKVSEADHKRDETSTGFNYLVEGNTYHFVAKKREAAQRLQIVIDSFGNIARKTFEAETAAINTMVDLLLSKYSEDLALLKLTEWATELKADNEAFNTISDERYTDDASKTELKMKDVRKQIDTAYRTITNLIDALVLVNGADAYAPFIKELNQRIEKYNLIIAQRKGRAKKDEEPEED